MQSVLYAPVKDIDFIRKKRKSCESGATSNSSSSKKPVPEASESEQIQFLNVLASCPGAKPAVLVVTPGYCDAYVPLYLPLWYSPTLTSLFGLVRVCFIIRITGLTRVENKRWDWDTPLLPCVCS